MGFTTAENLEQNMPIHQGDIYLADLSPVKGHEQAGFRPVLVMQNDILNANLNTVVIVPITANLNAKGKLTTYFLPRTISRLNQDSVVLLFQIRTIDKERLRKIIARLGRDEFVSIREQLKFVF